MDMNSLTFKTSDLQRTYKNMRDRVKNLENKNYEEEIKKINKKCDELNDKIHHLFQGLDSLTDTVNLMINKFGILFDKNSSEEEQYVYSSGCESCGFKSEEEEIDNEFETSKWREVPNVLELKVLSSELGSINEPYILRPRKRERLDRYGESIKSNYTDCMIELKNKMIKKNRKLHYIGGKTNNYLNQHSDKCKCKCQLLDYPADYKEYTHPCKHCCRNECHLFKNTENLDSYTPCEFCYDCEKHENKSAQVNDPNYIYSDNKCNKYTFICECWVNILSDRGNTRDTLECECKCLKCSSNDHRYTKWIEKEIEVLKESMRNNSWCYCACHFGYGMCKDCKAKQGTDKECNYF